jgi:hypothetical protein
MIKRIGPPVFLLVLGIVLCANAWGRVGDVLVDFGRELYVPWQLAEGRVLYRDLAYLYGPLSPYVNAVWWMLFGGGERAVIVGNVVVTAVVCVMLYRILVIASDRYATTVGVALFLVCGAFGAIVRVTNYNFLTPYAHGMTHGLLLGLGAVLASVALHRDRRPARAVVLGLCVGFGFLTKPEMFLGVAAAGVAGLVVSIGGERRKISIASAFAAAALAPPLLALASFAAVMPFDVAADGVLGGWQHASKPYVTDTRFYREGLGIEFVDRNAWKVARYACLYLQFILGLGLAALVLRKWLCGHRHSAIVLSLPAGVALFLLVRFYPYRPRFWEDIARGLPIFPVLGLIAGVVLSRAPTARSVALVTLSAMAGALLLKMGLNARLYHYGFALATPAAIVAVVLAIGLLPEWLDVPVGGGSGRPGCSSASAARRSSWAFSRGTSSERISSLAIGRCASAGCSPRRPRSRRSWRRWKPCAT